MINPVTHDPNSILGREPDEILMPTMPVMVPGIPHLEVGVGRQGDRVIATAAIKDMVGETVAEVVAAAVKMLQSKFLLTELVVGCYGFEPSALQLLDEATGGALVITPLTPRANPEREAALAALPRAERREAVPLVVSISELDFDNLVRDTCPTTAEAFVRFRALYPEEFVGNGWRYAYFMCDSWAGVMMARTFLEHHGISHQLVRDTDDEWVILTDFESAETIEAKARKAVKEQFSDDKWMREMRERLRSDPGADH